MHSSIALFSAFLSTAMAFPQSSGSLAVGAVCTSSSQCPAGVSCYAVNSNLITICGNTGATCTSDSDCAFNTCVSGSCEGVLSSTSASLQPSTAVTTVPTATATVIALGVACTSSSQCATGVSCYAVNPMLVTLCGNTGATCTSDSECAFNTCVSGSCEGPLSSSSSGATASSPVSTIKSVMSSSAVTTAVTTAKSSTISHGNVTVTSTSTGVPAGFTTSVTVINGVTSSVLVNSAGATTSFGAVATSVVTTTAQGSGAGKLAAGFGGILAVVGGAAMML